MDTDTNQQLHEFSKGMVCDISDAILQDGQYRMAKNLRYTTNAEENTGELHMIEGSRLAKQLNDEYIIASTQIRNLGVLITRNDDDEWCIKTFENPYAELDDKHSFNQIGELNTVFRSNLHLNPENKLSLVTRYEDDNNIKLYIADGEHPLMVFNLKQEYDTIEGSDYNDIRAVLSYPSVMFKKPIFCGLIDGALKSGLVEYSYQFYTKYGHQSEISPSTKLIPLYVGPVDLDTANKIEGWEQNVTTNKGIRIKIPMPTDIKGCNFDHLKVFRITYVQNGQLPMIEVFYDNKFDENRTDPIIIDDTGQKAIEVFTLEEYNSMTGIHIIPRVIESKNDYLFASNIKEYNQGVSQDIKEWDASQNVTYKLIKTDLIGDYNINIDTSIKLLPDNSDDELSWDSIKYIDKNNNSGTFDATDYLDSNINGIANYANPAVTYMLKSLHRGETYRYGIILYDKQGNASPVKYIDDIKVPDITDDNGFWETFDCTDLNVMHLHVKPVGVEFTINNLPNDVVSYEIVRCSRTIMDTKTISQGVISRPIKKVKADSTKYPYTPSGLLTTNPITMARDEDITSVVSSVASNYISTTNHSSDQIEPINNNNIYQFVSPEVCYSSDTLKSIYEENKANLSPQLFIYPSRATYNFPSNIDGFINVFYHNANNDYTAAGNFIRYFISGDQNSDSHIDSSQSGTYAGTANDNYLNLIITDEETQSTNDSPFSIGNGILISPLTTSFNFYTKDPENKEASIDDRFKTDYRDILNRVAYLKLYNSENGNIPQPVQIHEMKMPQQISWDEFMDVTNSAMNNIYVDKQTAIGNEAYVNFICGGMYDWPYIDSGSGWKHFEWTHQIDTADNTYNYLNDGDSILGQVFGTGGKCFVLSIDANDDLNYQDSRYYLNTYLCNIQQNVIPYGGIDEHAIETSQYNSYGDYFDASQKIAVVFDGDTFIQPFEYVSMHKVYVPNLSNLRTACIIYSIPVETSINLAYTNGYEYSRNKNSASGDITNIQVEPCNVLNKFTQSKPLYAYNDAYSANNNVRVFASELAEDNSEELDVDYRTYFSNKKDNNEHIDSWIKFMPANYLDVDTRYGEITGLRTFHNKLVFWQEEATGLFSVEERTTITDESNLPLILGTGGVLSRFDYLATSNGMHKNQFCDAQSDTTLYWWDYNKHELLGYAGGETVVSMSKTKLIQNMLNDSFNNNRLITTPMLVFDHRYNELLASIDDGRSIVYSEVQQAFSGTYDMQPKDYIKFADRLYLSDGNNTIHEWNQNEGGIEIFGHRIFPYLKYVVNKNQIYTKVFDNQEFGGRIYGGGDVRTFTEDNPALKALTFKFSTPLKQYGEITGDLIDNTEYNYRFAIPRHNNAEYGDRLRGKTMQCELQSSSNDYDFSLQWIKTKFRISWS